MAGTVPQPRSYQHLLGDMIDTFLSKYGLRGLKVGGPILSILETAAQSDVRGVQDVFNLLDSRDIDRAEGIALDRFANDEDAPRLPILPSSGSVTISDASFTKLATKVYPGAAAPNAGTMALRVADASAFPTSGQIYLGRGTTNYEGPISYSARSMVSGATYWTVTLVTPTQKFHDVNESVILAQGGNRQIPAGTVVRTAQGNVSDAVSFTTVSAAFISDGETEVAGVDVVCQQPGVIGNVPKGAINGFQSEPFSGAAVSNPLPFDNGQQAEDDSSLRERIKAKRKSRALGTALALITNAKGVQAPDENKTVISASIATPQGEPTTLFIDDGTGYEETHKGVALENLIDRALGGETYIRLSGGLPISKAFAQTTLTAPFSLVAGSRLAVKIAGVLTEHSFSASEFRAISNATAYEVVSAINGDPNLLFSARTSESGARVVIFSRADTNEDIEIVNPDDGIDANLFLGFPSGTNYTLRLYKDDQLLYKDGKKAIVMTAPQSVWKQTLGSGVYVKVKVDATKAVVYKLTDQDFIDSASGYSTVAALNSLESWATVLNSKIPGITASVSSGRLQITSNRGASAAAAIVVSEPLVGDVDENGVVLDGTAGKDPSFNLIKQGVFGSDIGLESYGKNNDYTLNRNTGELKLSKPLAAGQTLTAGTAQARAYIQSDEFPTSEVTVATGGAMFWVCVNAQASIVSTGVNASTSFTITNQGSGKLRYAASPANTYFKNVRFGDWVIISDPAFSVNGFWRVSAVDAAFSWFEIERPAVGLQSGVVPSGSGMVFVRSSERIQPVYVSAGTNRSLSSVASEINSQLVGASASVYRNKKIRITTDTFADDGSIFVAGVDAEGQKLKLPRGKISQNNGNHVSSIESGNTEIGTPNFEIGTLTAVGANTVDTTSSVTFTPEHLIAWGRRSGTYGKLASQYLPIRSVSGQRVTLRLPVKTAIAATISRAGTSVTITTATAHNFKIGDIFYLKANSAVDANFTEGLKVVYNADATHVTYVESGVSATSTTSYTLYQDFGALASDLVWAASTYSIGPEDNLTVVLDGNATTKSYNLPMYRKIKPGAGAVYGSTALPVVDADNSNASLATAFGTTNPDFFRDFVLYMKARGKSHAGSGGSAPTNYHYNKAILWRFARMGAEGNAARVAYVNPTAPNQGLAVTTTNGQYADISVRLPSGPARTGLNLTETTRFTTATNTTSTSLVTFTYSKPSITLQRTSDVVTATTSGSTKHGFSVGDVVYVTSPNTGVLPSGAKIVATVPSNTSFTYVEVGANTSAYSGGTVTSASTDPNFLSVQAGDIVAISVATGFPASNKGVFRVESRTATSFTFRRDNSATSSTDVPTTIDSTTAIQFFPINTAESTVSKIVTYVNANASDIVTAVAVENGGGAPGTGIIDRSTYDEYLNNYWNTTTASVPNWTLSDGINYVDSSNLTASTLTLKSAVSSGLISNSDFANEEMRLVPVTAKALVRFLSSPAVSGFYSGASIAASAAGSKVQIGSTTQGSDSSIQVTGGSANSVSAAVVGVGATVSSTYGLVTVLTSQARGITGNQWVAVQCQSTQNKTVAISSSTTMSIDPASTSGQWTMTFSDTVKTTQQTHTGSAWQVRKQGRFACYTRATAGASISGAEGSWVTIKMAGASPANTGTFLVVRKTTDSFWVENSEAVDEYVANQIGDAINFYSYDSVMPGDVVVIDTDVFGDANRGSFTVVGSSTSSVTVVGDLQSLSSTALGSGSDFVRFVEGSPLRVIKKIRTINRANALAEYSDIVFTTNALISKLSSSSGAVVQPLDKLQFPVDLVKGSDAYSYSTGLIGEVNRVIYGDSSNPSVYPGVVAAGATVNISGPLVKRIQIGLAVRISKGDAKSVIDRIKSAVASTVNKVPLGKAVDISSLVSAARAIDGVVSVAVVSPEYGAGTDLIAVQANEKPRILDADQDVLVSIVG